MLSFVKVLFHGLLPPSKCLCQIKSAHRGDEGGVINDDIMVFQEQDFFIQSSPGAFDDLP